VSLFLLWKYFTLTFFIQVTVKNILNLCFVGITGLPMVILLGAVQNKASTPERQWGLVSTSFYFIHPAA
jgi:hypothetical protein